MGSPEALPQSCAERVGGGMGRWGANVCVYLCAQYGWHPKAAEVSALLGFLVNAINSHLHTHSLSLCL